jgi:hypothetical protein
VITTKEKQKILIEADTFKPSTLMKQNKELAEKLKRHVEETSTIGRCE